MQTMTAILLLLCFTQGCNMESPVEGITIADIITLDASADSIFADGLDRVVLTATLQAESDANRDVTFKTDYGLFASLSTGDPSSGGQVYTITASGKTAQATLVSSLDVIDNVTVTASVGNFTAVEFIAFDRALPEELFIDSDKLVIRADKSEAATITATLLRDTGTVSKDTRVAFSVSPKGGSSAEGNITPLGLSDTEGTAAATLRSATTAAGFVTVTATVDGAGGGLLSRSMDIEFVP
jgi:hypothetical protein